MIQDYYGPVGGADVDQSIPVAARLLGRNGAGSLASLSFDKDFTRTQDRELLSLYMPTVVMPKRRKKNAAELERESGKKFVALHCQHSAVESEINLKAAIQKAGQSCVHLILLRHAAANSSARSSPAG